MQTGDTRKIRELLQKTEHYDADERFMATNDLIKELEKVEGFLDNSLQEPVRNAVLKQLDDKGKDVSTIAVKALSTLVQKFNPEQVTVIVQKLGKNIVAPGGAEEDSSRDVFVDGLRNVIAVIDDTNGKAFASDLLKTLLTGLRDGSKAHANISRMCMDVVKDILERFGGDVIEQHADLMKALTKLLNAEHPGVSQCASVTLGPLVGYLDEKEFNSFMLNVIIKNISGEKPDVYIQTVGVVCRAAGNRVGEYLPRIVPPLRKYCEQEAETPEATVVLWQECLQAFEFIILRCPNKVTEYISGIVALSLRLINYDPNFVQQVQGMEEGGDDDGWGDDDGDDAGWGDDDDAAAGAGWGDDEDPVPTANTADESWKVRLAAVGVISAFIRTRSDILKDYYAPLCDTLIARFSERDASVQEEVLLACRSLLNESVVMENGKKAGGAQDMEDDEPNVPTLVRQRSSAVALISKVPALVEGIDAVFQHSPATTKLACFAVLSALVNAMRSTMQEHLPRIFPHVVSAITGKATLLTGAALDLLHLLLELHSHEELQAYLAKVTEAVVASIEMDGEEALSVRPLALHALASIARRLPQEGSSALVKQVYEATLSQLKLKDTSQQVKVASIASMAVLLGRFGGRLAGLNERVLLVFGERLRNDSTREATLQALIKISNSDARCDLSYLVQSEEFILDLCSFMRQSSIDLKRYTVLCLEAIIRTHHTKIAKDKFADVLNEVAPHISDADLTLSHHVLDLVSTALKVSAATAPQVSQDILSRTIDLVNSPLLQGVSLTSTISFFQACVEHGGKVKSLSYDALLQSLLGVIKGSPAGKTQPNSVFSSVSQCIAGVTSADRASSTVADFVESVKKTSTPDADRAIALLSVGEIGRKIDASSQKGIDEVIVSAFSSEAHLVRDAAAFALGNLAVGNTSKFLPTILRLIEQRPDQQYLLLCSLKETIVSHSADAQLRAAFVPHLAKVTPLLFARAESTDEESRTVVASCLGRLAIIDPAKVLPALRNLLKSKNEALREVVIVALRSSFQPGADWAYLTDAFEDFFALLKDPSLNVRHQAVLTVSALLREKPSAVSRSLLDTVFLPALFAETEVHAEYVRIVDYGNFKESEDLALPLRKATFECLASLLLDFSEQINMQDFLMHTSRGLADLPDLQIATWQLFEKVAHAQPAAMLEMLDSLPGKVMATVKVHLQACKVAGQQGELSKDCLRAMVKGLTTYHSLAGVEGCAKFTHFYKQILATKVLQELLTQMSSK